MFWIFGSLETLKSYIRLNRAFYFFFSSSDDYVNQYASSVPKKTDEQSALNRILHETAA